MAHLHIHNGSLVIRFTTMERLFLRRESLVVPRENIRGIGVTPTPLSLARGARAGLHVSGMTKVGYWGLGSGHRQLVCAYRGTPGLWIDVRQAAPGPRYASMVLSCDNAADLVAQLGTTAVWSC